jgi:Fe-S cluster biogenesis protein NfuA
MKGLVLRKRFDAFGAPFASGFREDGKPEIPSRRRVPLGDGNGSRTGNKEMEQVDLKQKVEASLEKVRPNLRADGGDVELVEVSDDGVVKLALTGACAGCPMSTMTLKMGIERVLREEIPEVKEVEAV